MEEIFVDFLRWYKEARNDISNSDNINVMAKAYISSEQGKKALSLLGVIGRLSFKEIEMLVQLKHFDDSDYGNDDKRCAELIEATRNKVGYTKDDVKVYL